MRQLIGLVKTSLCTSWEISSLKVYNFSVSALYASRQIEGTVIQTNCCIHFSFYSARTTLFPQPLDYSRSGRRLGLWSVFLGPNLLLHFDVTPNGTESKTYRQFFFPSCRQTRPYSRSRTRIRCRCNITGTYCVTGLMLRPRGFD